MSTKSTGEILIEAAEYISEHGHHKGGYIGPDGSVCAVGAIHKVVGFPTHGTSEDWRTTLAVERATRAAAFELSGHGFSRSLAIWNDAEDRTAEDVILGLKRVGHELMEA